MARTTDLKLSAAYLLIFIVFSGIIVGYVGWNTLRMLDAQITETIETRDQRARRASNTARAACDASSL